MPEKAERPIPGAQPTNDRSNLTDMGPDDRCGTKSMHLVLSNREAGQGAREDHFPGDAMRSAESNGPNA